MDLEFLNTLTFHVCCEAPYLLRCSAKHLENGLNVFPDLKYPHRDTRNVKIGWKLQILDMHVQTFCNLECTPKMYNFHQILTFWVCRWGYLRSGRTFRPLSIGLAEHLKRYGVLQRM